MLSTRTRFCNHCAPQPDQIMSWRMRMLYAVAVLALGVSPALASDWPQWRGPNRDGHAAKGEIFPDTLPSMPRQIWQKNIGGGFSSPVLKDGKLLYLDASGGKETAHLVEAKTGAELWHSEYANEFGDEWGSGPRSTPILDSDRAYVQSCDGEFRCLNLAD